MLKIYSQVIVVLKLLCKREWSDLDVGLVKSGQKTLQSLSCICLFLLSDFVEFVSFIQCASSSRVMFHITLASHMELGTKLNIKLFGHRMCL